MPTNRRYRSRRRVVVAVSETLLKLLCGCRDYRAGIPPGELPEDCIAFIYFDTPKERRAIYEGVLPEITARCKQLGWPVPPLAEIEKNNGIPHHDKETNHD